MAKMRFFILFTRFFRACWPWFGLIFFLFRRRLEFRRFFVFELPEFRDNFGIIGCEMTISIKPAKSFVGRCVPLYSTASLSQYWNTGECYRCFFLYCHVVTSFFCSLVVCLAGIHRDLYLLLSRYRCRPALEYPFLLLP